MSYAAHKEMSTDDDDDDIMMTIPLVLPRGKNYKILVRTYRRAMRGLKGHKTYYELI